MAALGIRLRAQLRARWRSWALLALLAGVLGGLVVGAGAGSQRTQGSYKRYLGSINGATAYIDSAEFFRGAAVPLDRMARLPQVARSERTQHIAVISRSRSGRPVFPVGPNPVEYLVPDDGRPLDTIDRLKVLRGRLPNPARAGEMIGDTKALKTLGVDVGDVVTMRLFTQRQIVDPSNHILLSVDPLTAKWGPLVKVRVVGAAANARADIDGGQMHLTPAFYDAYGRGELGAWAEELVTKLKHGEADVAAFQRRAQRIAGKRNFTLYLPSVGHPKIQHSIDLQARALWLVTVLAAVAALVVVAQALVRLVATEARDDQTLRALGMSRGQNLAFGGVRALVIAAPAAALTTLIAFLVSPLAPIGWARQLEPDPGFAFDAPIVIGGAVAVFVVVWLVAFAATGRRSDHGRSRSRAGALGRWLAGAVAHPSFAAGVRMALAGRGSGSGAAARTTLAAAVVAVTVAVTALTFAASFRHLLDTPSLYGQTWDYETFGGPPQPPAVLHKMVADPGVTSIAAGADDTLEVNGVQTGARGMADLKGHIAPTVIEGRAPSAPGEVMLASKTLDTAGTGIGGFVAVKGNGRAMRLHVVGRGVLPSSKTNKLGYGAVMSFKTLKQLDPTVLNGLYEVNFAPGAAGAAARRRLTAIFDENLIVKPDEVGDFGRISNMPLYVALLFVGGAAAALAHALASSVRRRRRHLAILKTLGFTRPQVAAAVAWQATTIICAAALVGVPLGLGVGRFAWDLFAADLGVQPEAVAPVGAALLVVPVAVLLANAIAVVPGWAAARVRPAQALRTE